jgi:hypothetical protein
MSLVTEQHSARRQAWPSGCCIAGCWSFIGKPLVLFCLPIKSDLAGQFEIVSRIVGSG